MIAQPSNQASIPNTAAVLQLNCRRSHNVTYSLFNDPKTFDFLILSLQEPPVNTHTNLPSTHVGWHLVLSHPAGIQESTRP